MANRNPRDVDSRENSMRALEYVPPSMLPVPTPVDGWEFRWIATHVLGQAMPTNVSTQLRDGWEPVKLADHPELKLVTSDSKDGNVEVGGLMLCKCPTERSLARRAYYERKALSQVESMDNHLMQQSDPRMPVFRERSSSVTRGQPGFGSGSK